MHSFPVLALNPADPAAPLDIRPPRRWLPWLSVLAGALVLAGCAAPPRTEPAPVVIPTPAPVAPPPAVPAPPPAPPPTLAQEQRRLSELFRGTPVVFSIDRDGSFRSEVPLKHSFDAGKAVVKPALGAVLDRLAASPATAGAMTWTVAGPSDPKATGFALAMERAASVRDYLSGKGVAASRVSISALGSGPADAVVRVLVTPPAGTATPAAAPASQPAAAAKPAPATKAVAPKKPVPAKKAVPAKKTAPVKKVAPPAPPKPAAAPAS